MDGQTDEQKGTAFIRHKFSSNDYFDAPLYKVLSVYDMNFIFLTKNISPDQNERTNRQTNGGSQLPFDKIINDNYVEASLCKVLSGYDINFVKK